SSLVGIGYIQVGQARAVALRTADGRNWVSKDFPGGEQGLPAIYSFVCGDTACIAVGSLSPAGVERPAIWRTTDGLTWQPGATDVPDARQDGSLIAVVSTASGFLAIGMPDRDALLSRDGLTWRAVPVLTADDPGGIEQLAVNGDVIFGLGPDSIGGSRS